MQSEQPLPQMPDNFPSILTDFLNDLTTTFPEYADLWHIDSVSTDKGQWFEANYQYCLGVFPERFFDILYQNEEIFDNSSEANTHFLPNVDFKLLFNAEGISDTTRQAIWKYLQLILITIMSGIKDKSGFGETMNLFDGIDENELQSKLTETINNLTNFFKTMDNESNSDNTSGEDGGENASADADGSDFSFDGIPDAAGLHEHLKGLFDGKIGKLAKELAEEMSGEFMGMFGDQTDIKSTQDVFKKIMKNPKKIMDLLKTVGSKLETKMKDGDISKEEIMKEASELMGKMKGMGNGKEFQEMMKNLTKNMGNLGGMAGAMGKGAKFDMGAMQRMSSQLSQKERMRSKLDKKKTASEGVILEKKGDNAYSFTLEGEEKQEKSVRPDMRIPELNVGAAPLSDTKTVDDWLEEIEPAKTGISKSKKKKTKGKK
uniref:Uncharacterized protein n=1 Tax=viral metagenome TaxID=1070528 RepID=A0A6C0HZD8_9ZZZZ